MKKKSRREPIVLPSGVEAAADAKASRGQAIAKKATIGVASVVGAAALYYCLIPALAQNGGTEELYVFFDNGLSQYEGLTDGTVVYGEVYESEADEEADKLTMMRLSDVETSNSALWNAVSSQLGGNFDNINTDNVYVSTVPVTVGNYVSFTGYDSGTVYDTVTNYRINSASREWGYDYIDFQWTSEPAVLTEVDTCYYAPPQMMMNRYAGEAALEKGGAKTMVQFIWEHGDKKGDSYSKPEADGAWVSPQNADGRTFYDAVFIMGGTFGAVNGINELGYDSQSYYTEDGDGNIGYHTLEGSVALNGSGINGLQNTKKQYHATATFFDYFSDWEIAGNPIEEHEISYTYNNADGNDTKPLWGMNVDYSATAPTTANFPEGDLGGFEKVSGSGDLYVRTDKGDKGHTTGDGTYFLAMNGDTAVKYTLPEDATGSYYSASAWVRNATDNTQSVTLSLCYQLNGAEQTVVMDEISIVGWNVDNGVWTELSTGSFYLPEDATDAYLLYTSPSNLWLDDFTLKYEGSSSTTVTKTIDVAEGFAAGGDTGGFELVKHDGSNSSISLVNGAGKGGIGDGVDNGLITGDSQLCIGYGATIAYPIADAVSGNCNFDFYVTPSNYGLSYITVSVHYTLNGTDAASYYTYTLDGTLTGANSNGSNDNEKIRNDSMSSPVWHHVNGTLAIPEGATDVELWIQPYKNSGEAYSQDTHGTATYYLDDFSLSVTEYSTIASADFADATSDENVISQNYNFSTVEDIAGDTDNNSGYLRVTSVNSNGVLHSNYHMPAIYTMPTDLIKAGNYKFSMDITDTKYELRNAAVLLAINGEYVETITTLEINKTSNTAASGTWHTLTGEFTVPEDATSVQLYFQTFDAWYTEWDSSMYTDSAYYDNFKLEYETLATITESKGCEISSSVTTAYDLIDNYTDEQKTAAGYSTVRDYADFVGVTLENESTVVEDSIAKIYLNATKNGDNVPLQGNNTYSNKETYIINGRVYSTDKVRVLARHFKSQTSQDVQVGEDQVLGIYEPGAISISENFNPPIGAGSTLIFVEPVDDEGNVLEDAKVLIDYLKIGLDLIDIEGSFAEGTNTIAYSYQGSLFNDAISTYYDNAGAAESIIPLYFGSNSWMTGNMRYYHYESRTPQFLFNLSEIAKALANVGCETSLTRDDYINTFYMETGTSGEGVVADDVVHTPIYADGKYGNADYDYVGAYLIPSSREYWCNLFGYRYNTYDELTSGATEQELMGYFRNNTAIGFSNSRAVENLVWDQLAESNGETILGLDGTTIESPYFNEAFLRGDNEANAAYGTVYNNVDFSFAFNEDTGYYEYDSTRAWHATRLTEKTGGGYYMDYYNYDQLVTHEETDSDGDGEYVEIDETSSLMGVKKADTKYDDYNGSSQTIYQFYPFNSPDTNDRFSTENLMFGMKLDIPFNMYSDEEKRNNSMFKFSGDDDVWVYVDGNQVLDIGGTHTAVGGFIDLKNGYGIVGSSYADYTGVYKESMTFQNKNFGSADWLFHTGEDRGITNVEKAAFALLASLEEILPAAEQSFTSWTYDIDGINFFDDSYIAASSVALKDDNDAIKFQYQIRTLDNGEQVIDVKFRNVMLESKDKAKVKVAVGEICDHKVTAEEAVDTSINIYGLSEGSDCYVVTQSDWDAAGGKNCHPVGTLLPKEYCIYGDTGLTNHFGYPTVNGNVTFELNQFELAESTEELSDHTLSVYYMERGLNSSNFKLAFNFVPNAQKQVEKLWADGNEAHEDCLVEQDYVDVELWRTEPQRTTLTDADVSIPEGYSLVRAVSHNSKTDTGTANSTFISDSSQVTVQYELQDAAVANSAVTLSLNSMPISLEAYKQLYSSLGMRIYINDNLVPITDEDTSTIADYEFFKPGAEYETAYPTNGVGTAGSKITDEQRMTAIKIPASDSKSNTIVKIVFKQKDAKAKVSGNADTQFNTWGMIGCNAWLIDAYAFDADAVEEDTTEDTTEETTEEEITTDPSIGISSGSVFGSGTAESIASSTSDYVLNADEMQFAITRAVRYRIASGLDTSVYSSYYTSNYFATAIMPTDVLNLNYTYSDARPLAIWTGGHTNIFTDVTYELDSTYNGEGNTYNTAPDPAVFTIKAADATVDPNNVLMVTVGGKPHVNTDIGTGITYTATNEVETTTYSAPYKIDDSAIRLDSSVDWAHLWDNVAESVTLSNGDVVEYKYFIREIAASSEHGTELSDYQTLYYDAAEDGNLIAPTVVTDTDGNEMTLYSIDDTGYVQIVNNPITSAKLTKEWAVKEESDKINIVVTLYGEDSENPGVVTVIDQYLLSEDNNYTEEISSLPMYNPETGGEWTYYAAEDISGKYKASYDTTGVEKTDADTNETVTVYPLTEADDALSLSVLNQVEGFVLEINKVDEEGTTALEGAEFVLYEQNTDGSWAIVTKSATEEESEETETASVDSDSDSDAVAAASMNVVGNSYTGNSSVSNFGVWQVLGASVITEDVYYSFSDYDKTNQTDNNKYASYFDIVYTGDKHISNDMDTSDGVMTYNNSSYTQYLKWGSKESIAFTLNRSATVTLLCKYREDYGTATFKINDTVHEVDSRESDNTVVVNLEAGTYTLKRASSQIYLYYIGIDVSDEPVETVAVSPGEYYNFSDSTHPYADRFNISGSASSLPSSSSGIKYIDNEVYTLTQGLLMDGSQSITFTTNDAMYLTIVSPPNADGDKLHIEGTLTAVDKDGNTYKLLSHTTDELDYTRNAVDKNYNSEWTHENDVFACEAIYLPAADTYTITGSVGSPYVSYLDFSTYNKYDAENFNATLKSSTWFDANNTECFTLADELVNLQITQSGAKYDGTNAFNWGLMLEKNVGNGGWQKDPDHYQSGHWFHATIDNNVTTSHIQYLAKAYQVATDAAKKEQYRKSVIAGIYCLINSQYSNGGWPSVFENVSANGDDCPHDSYHCRITYNDGAMTHVMETLLDVRDALNDSSSDLYGIVDSTLATAAETSVIKGIDCFLETQITVNDNGVDTLTAWCQQHHETTGEPAPARAHELKALSAMESVGIIDFLRSTLNDSSLCSDNSYYTKNEIITSINAAVKWLNDVVITGYTYNKKIGDGVSPLTYTGNADDYLWARYYAIEAFPCDNYISTTDEDGKINAFDSASASGDFDVYSGNETTIAVNDPIFVERTEATSEPGHYSYITPGYENKTSKEYITVYNSLSGLPEDQQKSYSWYVTDATKYIGMSEISTETDLTGTLISNVHVNDVSNFGGWSIDTDLQLGDLVYGDRDGVTYATLPDALVGAEYVRTACDSKNYANDLATLTAAENIDVYVALDSRVADNTVPTWLSDWTKTELTAVNNKDVTFILYKTSVAAGDTITLGSNGQSSGCVGYTVMAVASTEEATTTTTTTTITTTTTTTTTTVSSEETPAVTTTVSSETETDLPANAMLYITNSNGRVNIGGLQPGTYKLVETKAPLGYVALVDEIVFTVGAAEDEAIDTSTITYTPNDGTNVTMAWATDKELTLVATVRNKFYAITMPNTGARGVYPVFIGSALFAAAAFAGGMMRRRNKKR